MPATGQSASRSRSPASSRYPRVTDKRQLLEDPTGKLILTAAVNCDRAAIAIEAMQHGKDMMGDKPDCTTIEQLADLRRTVAETGRIWSVN